MKSSVSVMLSHGSGEPVMSHPDYEQHAHHHGCLLVLVRGIGPSKPRSLQKIFERLQKVNNVKINDLNGQLRDIWIRFVQDHPVENNDWGDFQTHRRLLGLITVGKFDTQTELNELCRVHESLKVKYTNTLYDSRCILFNGKSNKKQAISTEHLSTTDFSSGGGGGGPLELTSLSSTCSDGSQRDTSFNSSIGAQSGGGGGGGGGGSSSGSKSGINSQPNSLSNDNASPSPPPSQTAEDKRIDQLFTMPINFKTQAYFYPENDPCVDLETNIVEFLNSLFWILESKRLEKLREKTDKVILLQAPFEKKDFVGLDLDTRNNRKRCSGRVIKNLADLTLQAGLVQESLTLFHTAAETLRAISDSLWLGAATEGLCAASAILHYPTIRYSLMLQRNASLQENSPTKQNSRRTSQDLLAKQMLGRKYGLNVQLESDQLIKTNHTAAAATCDTHQQELVTTSASSSTSSVSSMLSTTSSSTSTSTSTGLTASGFVMGGERNTSPATLPANILQPDEIALRYRDAIINYSKYRHAGIIETEAALKAARICIEQRQNLDVAMFLQSVLYINLNMTEQERVHRFETLTELYQQIGYHRKSAFFQRLAAWRYVAQTNTNPDWSQSYRQMLNSFPGYLLSLDPIDVLQQNAGWPCLQIDLLQQLVVAAKRLGHSALATRHMTFLLQTMWKHFTPAERREKAIQLQNLSAQCEGAPIPLVLENGTVIPPANLTDLPYCLQFQVKELPAHMRPNKIALSKIENSPFLFTPIHFTSSIDRRRNKSNNNKIAFQWIQNDLCEVAVKLKNPLPFELRVGDIRLLSNGVVFESLPETVILPSSGTTTATLHGTPIEFGSLEIQGFSTHTLGVKSNCRLKAMKERSFPPNYTIEVIPSLPKLTISTSLPQTATFSGMTTIDSVIVTASLTIYNGESSTCTITLTNSSTIPIEYLDETIQSTLDPKLQNKIFKWNSEELQKKLPIPPNGSIDFTISIFAEADFLGPVVCGDAGSNGSGGGGGVGGGNIGGAHGGIGSFSSGHYTDGGNGPSSLMAVFNNLSVSGHTSLPSRVNSPINTPLQRRTELTSSFRSTNSGHSSLATTSLGPTGNTGGGGSGAVALGGGICSTNTRHIDMQMRFRYSGGGGLNGGYCRQCAIAFNFEFMPSAQVTNWDVLPAEIPSQFYLVLDVINLTAQEMTLNYTPNKNIIIEAKESCRVPVPVEKCPLERILAAETLRANTPIDTNSGSIVSSNIEQDLTEKICSEHIADQVNLEWTLAGTNTQGLTSLSGIRLSSIMLDLITVAPLQWEIFIDEVAVPPQAEVTCAASQDILIGIKIVNLSPSPLKQLLLTLQFYQDYQNGVHNYKMETRVATSGSDQIFIDYLDCNESAFHECTAIFFTPGRFKADIQCRSQQPMNRRPQNTATTLNPQAHQQHNQPNYLHQQQQQQHQKNMETDTQAWRFIPPLDITVTE